MNMQPAQGPQAAPVLRKFAIDDTMQVKSSWGSRSVKIQNLNTNEPHTIKLKELVKLLDEKIKSVNSPQEIKRAREMFHTIKTMEGGSRSYLTRFFDFIGVKNDYDKKFAELGKKIEAPLLREEHLKELADLKLSLVSKQDKLAEAEMNAGKEDSSNAIFGKHETSANEGLKELQKEIDDLESKISVQEEVIELSFPETKLIEKMVKGLLLTPEQEENAKLAGYSRFDQLINVDDDELRLLAANMAVKMAAGYELTPKEEAKSDFLQSLNNILKSIPLKKEEDLSLKDKKDVFIKNLKSDSPLRVLLANEELQKLAKEMDDVMDKNISMQDFANIVGIDYPERIRAALGTEDIDDASVALFLLQKNTTFLDSLKKLYEYRDDHRDFSLKSIETDLAPHFLAMEMLDEVSEITSQIAAIDNELNALDSILDLRADALQAERDNLVLRMNNYS